MRALPVLFAALSLASVAVAQSPADVLRAEPKSFKVNDLPDDYRAVTIGGTELSPWMLFGMSAGGGSLSGSDALLFRSVSAVWVQPDEFAELLDGKRSRIRGLRLDTAALAGARSATRPEFTETWLEAGRIVSWSAAPELSKPALLRAFGESETASEATRRMSNLKQAATAVMLYISDNDDIFPRADSSATFYELVLPYLKSREIVAATTESGRMLYNTALSGTSSSKLERPAETVLLWEERAWPDGKRAVTFADSHGKGGDAAEWSRLWSAELARRSKARGR